MDNQKQIEKQNIPLFHQYDSQTVNLSDSNRLIISNSLYNIKQVPQIQSQNFENSGKSALAALTSGKNFSYKNKKIFESNQITSKRQNLDISIIGQKVQKKPLDSQNSTKNAQVTRKENTNSLDMGVGDNSLNDIMNKTDVHNNSMIMKSTLHNQGEYNTISGLQVEEVKSSQYAEINNSQMISGGDMANILPHQVIIQTAKKIQQLQEYSILQTQDDSFRIDSNAKNILNSINEEDKINRSLISMNNNQNIQEIFSQIQKQAISQDTLNELQQKQIINKLINEPQEISTAGFHINKFLGQTSQQEELFNTNQLSLFSDNYKGIQSNQKISRNINLNNAKTQEVNTFESSLNKKWNKNQKEQQFRKTSQQVSNQTQTDDRSEIFGPSQGLPNMNLVDILRNQKAQVILPYQQDQYINTADGLIKRSSSYFDQYKEISNHQSRNQKNQSILPVKSMQNLKGSQKLNEYSQQLNNDLTEKVLQFTVDQINGSNQSQFFWQSKNMTSISPRRIVQSSSQLKHKPNLLESILGKPIQKQSKLHNTLKKDQKLDNKIDGNQKPQLNITQEDLFKLYMNKNASGEFILENQKEILKYLEYVMNSEEKMVGYQEYSNKNMLSTQEKQKEKVSGLLPEINQSRQLIEEEIIQPDILIDNQLQNEKTKKGRYDFNIEEISKKNRSKLALLMRKPDQSKNEKKGIIQDSNNINARVMEHWLNETLEDAEHLDIPSVILKPEHKKPIQRYGIDRQELFNAGIPNDFIDRIYRCLYVYSVGFFDMIKKILEHSGQRYALITRIWKVFSVVLEYCCVTDYKMMISQISVTHEQEIQKIVDKNNQKFEEFFANEKILKQNIAILQKNNEELERDRTNERSLRMKLEEEYMQNTKNHEEEVQLRLKFESKLNQMHTQQRETDIKYNRASEENIEKENQIKLLEQLQKELKQKVAESSQIITEQREQISIFQEQKTIWEHDMQNNQQMIEQMENRVKLWQDEVNTKRYEAGKLQNENSKLQMQLEILESKNQALQTRNESLETLFEQTRKEKLNFEEKSKELKSRVDLQQVNISQHEQKQAIKSNDVYKKNILIETQQNKLEEQGKLVEDLLVLKQTHRLEIDSLSNQVLMIKKDFDEASEKLHKMNRYRHELELRYKSEKMTQERLTQTLLEKEKILEHNSEKIGQLNERCNQKDRKISTLMTEAKDMRDEINTKINQYQHEIQELQIMVKKERIEKDEWSEKFAKHEHQLSQRTQKVLTLEQQLKVLQIENDQVNLKIESLHKTLVLERQEREQFEREAHSTTSELRQQKHELNVVTQVSKQLELQRLNDQIKYEDTISNLEQTIQYIENSNLMKIEDLTSQIFRIDQKLLNAYKIINVDHKRDLERKNMYQEDLYRSLYNQMNLQLVQEFEIVELLSKIKSQEREMNDRQHRISYLEELQEKIMQERNKDSRISQSKSRDRSKGDDTNSNQHLNITAHTQEYQDNILNQNPYVESKISEQDISLIASPDIELQDKIQQKLLISKSVQTLHDEITNDQDQTINQSNRLILKLDKGIQVNFQNLNGRYQNTQKKQKVEDFNNQTKIENNQDNELYQQFEKQEYPDDQKEINNKNLDNQDQQETQFQNVQIKEKNLGEMRRNAQQNKQLQSSEQKYKIIKSSNTLMKQAKQIYINSEGQVVDMNNNIIIDKEKKHVNPAMIEEINEDRFEEDSNQLYYQEDLQLSELHQDSTQNIKRNSNENLNQDSVNRLRNELIISNREQASSIITKSNNLNQDNEDKINEQKSIKKQRVQKSTADQQNNEYNKQNKYDQLNSGKIQTPNSSNNSLQKVQNNNQYVNISSGSKIKQNSKMEESQIPRSAETQGEIFVGKSIFENNKKQSSDNSKSVSQIKSFKDSDSQHQRHTILINKNEIQIQNQMTSSYSKTQKPQNLNKSTSQNAILANQTITENQSLEITKNAMTGIPASITIGVKKQEQPANKNLIQNQIQKNQNVKALLKGAFSRQ